MISVDTRDVKKLERDLKTFAKRAYPFATNATINRTAFSARDITRDMIRGKMIERNKWTRNSIQVAKSMGLYVSKQMARMGSTADYMETQEFGDTLLAKGTQGRPIATPAASGEQALPRRKLPRKPNQLRNIRLTRGGRHGATRAAKNRATVQQAAAGKGSRYVFLDMGRRSGIYKVMGGKRKPRLRKMYDLSRRVVRVPARPTIKPATDKAARELPRHYADALRFQLQRHKILGYT